MEDWVTVRWFGAFSVCVGRAEGQTASRRAWRHVPNGVGAPGAKQSTMSITN